MSSLRRTFAILDMFGPDRMVWTAEELIDRLGYSRPTGYRYIRELLSIGMLVRGRMGLYTLGPRIVELDYLVRQADVILASGLPTIRKLAVQTACDINVVEIYGDRIVTTHQERASEPLALTFSRGRPFPLLRGAASRMIISQFSTARLRRLYAEHGAEAAALGYGADFDAFRRTCAATRRRGFTVSEGELDPEMAGIAVPLVIEPGTVAGCIVAALPLPRLALTRVESLAELLRAAARTVEGEVRAMSRSGFSSHAA